MHVPTEVIHTGKAQSEAVALFVSDVHLQPSLPCTTQAFTDFLLRHANKAQQLYLLGDLFESWAGDDDLVTAYNKHIAEALRAVSDAGTSVFWIAGNRDFLIGEQFARIACMTLLGDPHVADIGGQHVLLAHGDAQCTDDHAYMIFRTQVRQPEWQKQFLAMPLAQRKAIIDGMRTGSREAQRNKTYEIMDVNAEAIASLFENFGTTIMIHGHTHRPATHFYQTSEGKRVRYVLPDWDCDCESPRGGWLSMDAKGTIRRHALDGSESFLPPVSSVD